MHYDRATKILTSVSLTPLSGRSVEEVTALVSNEPDWQAVLTRSAQWDVEAVVMFNLSRFFIQYIPEPFKARVLARERETRAVNLSHSLLSVQLAALLEREGVDAIVIKGAAVALSGYGDASLRSFSDADLLVRRADLRKSRSILESKNYTCGYQVKNEQYMIDGGHALELTNGRFRVELHWQLIETHLRWNPGLDEIWNLKHRVPCVGGEINVLAPHVEFLFLCAHGVKHRWSTGKWICDIAQLAGRLSDADVTKTVELAERTGAKRLLQIALQVTNEIVDFSDERFPAEYFEKNASVSEHVAYAKQRLLGFAPDSTTVGRPKTDYHLGALVAWVNARESWRDRTAIAFAALLMATRNENLGLLDRWLVRPSNLLINGVRAFLRTWLD